MPTTATFKSKLYAHASRAARPRRALADSEATTRGGVKDTAQESTHPDLREAADALLPAAFSGRTLSDLPDRGALLDPKAVATMIFPGTTERELPGKMKWVRENLPFKVPLVHRTVGWFEADVRWWLEDRRNGNFDVVEKRRRATKAPKKATERAAPVKSRRRVRRKGKAPRAKNSCTTR